jgi:dTDP-4-amino-4,6-dideoxygalactose transaminase
MPIEFFDMKIQRGRVREAVETGWTRVVDNSAYIMGPEVGALEQQLGAFCDAKEVISCASGTDAIWLPLLALDIGPGDAVFLPSWTFTATAEAVCLVGATPVFVDVDADTYSVDPDSLKRAISFVKNSSDLTPRAIMTVDLFGAVADYDAINAIARESGLKVIADAAQSFGATLHGRRVGSLADVTGTSFYPTKPLAAWGDGGAVLTDDAELAEIIRSIRIHGRGTKGKYDNVRVGTNSRLHTLQAVVLIEKLKIFDEEFALRQKIIARYDAGFDDRVGKQAIMPDSQSAWALYTVKLAARDEVAGRLKEFGVPTGVYYPRPLHMQAPYRDYPIAPGGLPVTEHLKDVVLSLPMHPYLTEQQTNHIVSSMCDALA